MTVPAAEANEVYRRLLAGEPDAPADLYALFLDPLVAALAGKYPFPSDPDLVHDMVTDAITRLVKEPARYRPERGSLWSYLYMDANGDIKNALSRQRPTLRLVRAGEDGEEEGYDPPDLDVEVEGEVLDRVHPEGLPEGVTREAVRDALRRTFPEERDRALVSLMSDGVRETDRYARVLGIADRPVDEQQRLVKQHKDRLSVAMRRLGSRLRHE
jgi:RNA polymerase sigma-70 factor (ECF subfamily)